MNNDRKDPIIGIVGGMGPQAGVALFNSIMHHTVATIDQEHLSVILMSFPAQIPDRTAFLQGAAGRNPAYPIAGTIRKLEKAGATVAGIACNTSHCPGIYDVIRSELERMDARIALLHMPEETCIHIGENYPHIRRVGVMTTNGTYQSGIYRDALQRYGYDVVLPGPRFQDEVIHRSIYDRVIGLKATPDQITGQARSLVNKALHFFRENGAELVVLGCTDLSILLSAEEAVSDIPIADSTEALAMALIKNVKMNGTKIRV